MVKEETWTVNGKLALSVRETDTDFSVSYKNADKFKSDHGELYDFLLGESSAGHINKDKSGYFAFWLTNTSLERLIEQAEKKGFQITREELEEGSKSPSALSTA